MSLPNQSPSSPRSPKTLAQAVAQLRQPRNPATARLLPHRDELLRLRRAGESVETLAAGLRLIGVEIGRETLRRWIQRELKRKPIRRRKAISAATSVSEDITVRPIPGRSLTDEIPIPPS